MGNQQVSVKRSEPLVYELERERPGESPVYRQYGFRDELRVYEDENIRTLADIFRNSVEQYPDSPLFGTRHNDGPFEWETYSDVNQRVMNFGSGLINLGCQSHGDFVGIYSKNRAEWMIAEEACNAYSLTIIPLYDTLGPEACNFIINQAEIRIVICTEDHTEALLAENTPSLTTIIQTGKLTKQNLALAEEKGIELITFTGVERKGEAHLLEADYPAPDEIHTICYTSGTTGDPKGVIITHGNFVACLSSAKDHGVAFKHEDVHISYLPLAHIFEKIMIHAMISAGGAVGFFRGDITQLFEDIAVLRPTIFPSVPRLFNRLFDKINSGANEAGGIKAMLFNTALRAKVENLKEGYMGHSVWDKLVFSKVAAALGGRVRFSVTGSAPLSSEVLNFLRVALSCPVLEGYGQTETCGVATITVISDTTVGHVGIPISAAEVKLVDVEDMNYTTDGEIPRGEICVRGAHCTPGYYKNEEKTAELIDEHGWLHTGDIGEWKNNRLTIIDRKKNIFKLSHGEYIAPEKLENIYVKAAPVQQIFVHGISLKTRLIAIVVPDPEVVLPWARQNGLPDNMEDLVKTDELKQFITDSIHEVGQQGGVKGFERIADIHLSAEPFTVENDLLTPTFKLKRPQTVAKYAESIDAMYEKLD